MPDNSLLELDKAGSVGPASQTIIVDGIVIDNVELFMESGSHLIVKNGGTLKLRSGKSFYAPTGAIVDISSGYILP